VSYCAVAGCAWPVEPCPFHPKAKRKAALTPIVWPTDPGEPSASDARPHPDDDRIISTDTRRAEVLALLTARANTWVPGPELAVAALGGSEGLRRVRELREDKHGGYIIEVRRMSGRDAYEYRLLL
jgi:hypothetical protein